MNDVVTLAQSVAETQTMGPEFWRVGIKAIADGSAAMVSWALAIAAGSIVTIVSTSYMRPPAKMRWVYLLFLPGWACLAVSVFQGDAISRRYLAAQVGEPTVLRKIALSMNPEYADQQQYLSYALIVFGIWLVIFLFWWVFDEPQRASGAS